MQGGQPTYIEKKDLIQEGLRAVIEELGKPTFANECPLKTRLNRRAKDAMLDHIRKERQWQKYPVVAPRDQVGTRQVTYKDFAGGFKDQRPPAARVSPSPNRSFAGFTYWKYKRGHAPELKESKFGYPDWTRGCYRTWYKDGFCSWDFCGGFETDCACGKWVYGAHPTLRCSRCGWHLQVAWPQPIQDRIVAFRIPPYRRRDIAGKLVTSCLVEYRPTAYRAIRDRGDPLKILALRPEVRVPYAPDPHPVLQPAISGGRPMQIPTKTWRWYQNWNSFKQAEITRQLQTVHALKAWGKTFNCERTGSKWVKNDCGRAEHYAWVERRRVYLRPISGPGEPEIGNFGKCLKYRKLRPVNVMGTIITGWYVGPEQNEVLEWVRRSKVWRIAPSAGEGCSCMYCATLRRFALKPPLPSILKDLKPPLPSILKDCSCMYCAALLGLGLQPPD
jgi:hypothetical protein